MWSDCVLVVGGIFDPFGRNQFPAILYSSWSVQQSTLSVEQINASLMLSTVIRVLLLLSLVWSSSLTPKNSDNTLLTQRWYINDSIWQTDSPLRKHCTPAFSTSLDPQLWWGRQSSKLLSDPLHPKSSRRNGSSLEVSNFLSDPNTAVAPDIVMFTGYKANQSYWECTFCRKSKLSTHNSCVIFIPHIITHSPPLLVSTDLHSSLSVMSSSSQSNITILT